MDEIVGNVDVSSMATGAISGFAEVVLWLAVIIGVLGVIGLGWFFLSFKHKVRVRQVLNDGTSRIIDDKARFSKDKHGVGWWKLRKLNMKVAEPPSQVKESSINGKLTCEGYLVDGMFFWRKNRFSLKDFEDKKADFIEGGFDAISAGERSLYLDDLERSDAYKKKKLSELLWQSAPIIGIIIMLTLFFIFFDNVITPGYEIAEQNAKMVEQSAEMTKSFEKAMQILDDVVSNRQTIWLDNVSAPPN